MFKKNAPVYSAFLIGYLCLITLLRWQFHWQLVFLWLGGFLGLLIYNLDHVTYLLWQNPEGETAVRFRQLTTQRRFKEAFALLTDTCGERKRLVGHSVVFQATLLAVSFFAVSSTNSLFGKGLVMAMLLYSLINQGMLLANGSSLANWFWQVRIKRSSKIEAFYYLGMVLFFLLFSWMLI
ncbi:MAG: hypothetical protein JW991_04715 [Candidatus Pacebacteria bacterium]|nr:hypothetical protein [Candidatus Paceibacterota bacterium]